MLTHICSSLVHDRKLEGANGTCGAAYPSKCAQACKDTSSYPGRVFPLRWCKDLDSHVLNGQSLNLVQKPVAESLGQSGSARENNVAKERFAEVHVGSADCVDNDLVDARVLEADDFWVEQDLGSSEPFRANLDECQHFAVVTCDFLYACIITFSFCPSGSVYSMVLSFCLPAPAAHSFSSFLGSRAT